MDIKRLVSFAFVGTILCLSICSCQQRPDMEPAQLPDEMAAEFLQSDPLNLLTDRPLRIGPITLAHLSADSATGAFVCSYSLYTTEEKAGCLLYSDGAVYPPRMTTIAYPQEWGVYDLYRFPIGKHGFLSLGNPLDRSDPDLTILQYAPDTDSWKALMKRPKAHAQNGGLVHPVAWSPSGERFIYYECHRENSAPVTHLREYDITSGQTTMVAEDVALDFQAYWTVDNWIYFGRNRAVDWSEPSPTDLDDLLPYLTCDIYRVRPHETGHEERITSSGNVFEYAVDPSSGNIVVAQLHSATRPFSIIAMEADGSHQDKLFSLPNPLRCGHHWQPAIAGDLVVATNIQAQGPADPRLVFAQKGAKKLWRSPIRLQDSEGNWVRGRNPRFISPHRIVFIGPWAPDTKVVDNVWLFEKEWLYTYDFSDRVVRRLEVPSDIQQDIDHFLNSPRQERK